MALPFRIYILTSALFILCSCEKNECLSYEEAVEQGKIERKSSGLIINDSLTFELDFVMDKNDEYTGNGEYCVGSKALKQDDFNKAAGDILSNYNPKKVNQLNLHFAGISLCEGGIPDVRRELKGYTIYYCDKSNRVMVDYVNLVSMEKETHWVSQAYGTVKVYYLFKSAQNAAKPCSVSLKNEDFILGPEDVNFINKMQDTLYLRVQRMAKNSQ